MRPVVLVASIALILFLPSFYYFHHTYLRPPEVLEATQIPRSNEFVLLRTYLNIVPSEITLSEYRHYLHVVIAANGPYLHPLLACVNSLQTNSNHSIFVHVLTAPEETDRFVRALQPFLRLPLEIAEFDDTRVKPLIRVWEGKDPRVYYNTFNYARYYLPDIFPYIDVMLYLDPDTIVVADIYELFELFNKRSNQAMFFMATPSKDVVDRFSGYCYLLNCDDLELKAFIDPNINFFNAGVFMTDLARWRKENVTGQLESWLVKNTKRFLWRWGSQAPLALVFYEQWLTMPMEWNQRNARRLKRSDNITLDAKIYHFTSAVKPWKLNGKRIWEVWCPYYPNPNEYWFCKPGSIRGKYLSLIPNCPQDYFFLRRILETH